MHARIDDPAGLAAVDLSNPQSLNRYAYVLNVPTIYTDPFGLDCQGGVWGNTVGASPGVFTISTTVTSNCPAGSSLDGYPDGTGGSHGVFGGEGFAQIVQSAGVEYTEPWQNYSAANNVFGPSSLPEFIEPKQPQKQDPRILYGIVYPTFGHGFRHLLGTGLGQAEVESVIAKDVLSSGAKGNYWGWVRVSGQWIQYRYSAAQNFVGTYFPVSKWFGH